MHDNNADQAFPLKVGFKHEGPVRDEGVEPEGKIHVFRDGEPPTVTLWGSVSEARLLAEIIGAEFYAY